MIYTLAHRLITLDRLSHFYFFLFGWDPAHMLFLGCDSLRVDIHLIYVMVVS